MTTPAESSASWATGCDYSFPPHPTIAALQAVGIKFVCRYLSSDVTKNISPDEVTSFRGADIAIVLNWEVAADAMALGATQGTADAQAAQEQAEALNMADAPIYFSADFDATPDQVTACVEYMRAVNAVIGLARSGVYGDYNVVKACQAASVVTFSWGTPAWTGDPSGWKVNIYQYESGAQIGGVYVDLDAGYGTDWGQWPRPSDPAPPPPVWPQIGQNDTGYKVETIQYLLNVRNFGLAVDGIFGLITLAAVRSFQSENGLAIDGIVGPITWGALILTVAYADGGYAVEAVQKALNVTDNAGLALDGEFGPDTLSAVKKFQNDHSLNVDGIVGPLTWNAIVNAE